MEDAFRAYADADAKQRSLTAEMDGKLVEIREDYADRLAELDAEKKAAFEKMQVFAVENREELFTRRKSMETTHGIRTAVRNSVLTNIGLLMYFCG